MRVLLNKLLFESNIFSIEKEPLRLHLIPHPEYGNLRAITATLDQLSNQFLAIIEREDVTKIILVAKKGNQVQLVDEDFMLTEEDYKNQVSISA